jgi:UDP-3-O-[3-hydroxymyristoyl] glucosamine N-acyltransferase
MSNFALDTNSSAGDIISSLNYALSNLGGNANAITVDQATGQVVYPPGTPTGNVNIGTGSVASYINQYLDVKYANNATGSDSFSSVPTNKRYFGVYNTASTTISSNPVDYIWTEVTNGFGTTKQLWYQTIGGRQINFFAGNAAPSQTFVPVPAMPLPTSAPINLDVLTGVENNLAINVNAFYQANTAPATPSGGYYNFPTLSLTPPVGWSSTIPSFVANTSIYVSTAAFVGNINANVPPSTNWTSPVVYVSQFNGNTGAQGARGFVPLGFVVCASDPTTYGDVDFTNAFSASRSNASPPIGLGYTPITGDTAQFFYANVFNPNNDVTLTKSYNSNTSPQWSTVTSQVVSGGLIVPGTITANTLNANQVYAITVQSTNATIGDNNSPGYWFQANTGNARVGGALSIGNFLTVGAGARFGSNLVVGDSAGIGNNLIVGTNALIGNNATIQNNLTVGQNAQIGANLNIGNSATIGNNLTVGTGANIGGVIIAGSLAAGTVGNLQLQTNLNGGVIAANTIVGTAIVTGSITADKLAANVLIVGNITSFGSTIEVPSGTGYWLDYTNGNVYFGGNTVVGNNLRVGTNAQIGNNLTVGTNATIGGVIIGGAIATGQVGNVQLQSNLDGSKLANNSVPGATIVSLNGSKIDAGSITTTQIGNNAIAAAQIQANAVVAGKIAANAVTAGTVAANAITAGAIAADAVTATAIAANAVTAGKIAADAVTATTIAANAVTAGKIAANAVTATTIAADAVTATAIAAGTITGDKIAANTITGTQIAAQTITGNNIGANTVTTTNLIFNSATGSASKGPNYPGSYNVPFINNGVTNPTAPNYMWPQNTRGYAIDGGLSYVPNTNGNSVDNTRLVVVYSGYVFSANAATVVELWKSGGSAYYSESYNNILSVPPNPASTIGSNDTFYVVGANGYYGYSYDGTNWVTARSAYSPNGLFECVAGYTSSSAINSGLYNIMLADGSILYATGNNQPSNSFITSKPAATYGTTPLFLGQTYSWELCVGANGLIWHGALAAFGSGTTNESSPTTQSLYGVATNYAPSTTVSSNVVAVAVGSNGTVLRNTYTYSSGSLVVTGWETKSSTVITDLYAVASNWSNYTSNTAATLWCAVGENGVILTSPDGNTWTQRTSPTTQTLYGVTYGNGYWCAVGAQSTICYSTDGINWTATQGPIGNDSQYRTLTSVTYGWRINRFVATGQAIMVKSSSSNPTSWIKTYDAGVSVASSYTRLASWGSDGSNIANVTVPSANQQLGSQAVSGSYTDYNYSANVAVTYYLVMGNLTGNAVQTNSATLQVTEFKR